MSAVLTVNAGALSDCRFMLDIPPPPQDEPGSPTSLASSDPDDIVIVPSSDDEQSQGGSWKLVGREKPRVTRRRTTQDQGDCQFSSLLPGFYLSELQIGLVLHHKATYHLSRKAHLVTRRELLASLVVVHCLLVGGVP